MENCAATRSKAPSGEKEEVMRLAKSLVSSSPFALRTASLFLRCAFCVHSRRLRECPRGCFRVCNRYIAVRRSLYIRRTTEKTNLGPQARRLLSSAVRRVGGRQAHANVRSAFTLSLAGAGRRPRSHEQPARTFSGVCLGISGKGRFGRVCRQFFSPLSQPPLGLVGAAAFRLCCFAKRLS